MRNTTIRRFMIEGRKSASLWKGSHQCHPKSILQVFYPQFSFWGSSHQALAIAALTFTTELFAETLLIAYWETICPEHSSFTLSWTSSTTWSFLKGPVSHYIYICTHKKQHVVFLLAQRRWLLPETTVGFVQCLWGRMHKLEIQRHKAPGGMEHMNTMAFISLVIASAGKSLWCATDYEHQRNPKKSFTSTQTKNHLFSAHKAVIFSSNLWWLLVINPLNHELGSLGFMDATDREVWLWRLQEECCLAEQRSSACIPWGHDFTSLWELWRLLLMVHLTTTISKTFLSQIFWDIYKVGKRFTASKGDLCFN